MSWLLVLASLFIGPAPMDLVFGPSLAFFTVPEAPAH